MIKNITRARSFLCLLTTNMHQEGNAICLHVHYHGGQWHMFTRMSPLWPAVIRLFPKGSAPLKNRNKTHKRESPTLSLSAAFLGLSLLFDEQSEQLHQSNKGFCSPLLYLFKVLNGKGGKYRHPTRTVIPAGSHTCWNTRPAVNREDGEHMLLPKYFTECPFFHFLSGWTHPHIISKAVLGRSLSIEEWQSERIKRCCSWYYLLQFWGLGDKQYY